MVLMSSRAHSIVSRALLIALTIFFRELSLSVSVIEDRCSSYRYLPFPQGR